MKFTHGTCLRTYLPDTGGGAGAGQVLRITGERLSGREQLGAEVRGGTPVDRTRIGGQPEGVTGEQRQVIGLARMGDREGLGHQRAVVGQPVDVRGGTVADDVSGSMVLLHHDHDVRGSRQRRRDKPNAHRDTRAR